MFRGHSCSSELSHCFGRYQYRFIIQTPPTWADCVRRFMAPQWCAAPLMVNGPTRVTNASHVLVDRIITDQATRIEQYGLIDTFSITDHRGIRIADHKLIHCTLHFKRKKLS